ncbi:Cullin binding-domain-containing protein [Chytriomyces sp. MP71]|nr:Cullin binding-domain-containing protein [Chytriomyces sp. MP71]
MAVADPGKTTTHPVASKRARASSKNTSSSALTANQIPNPTSNSKRTTIDSSFSALVCAAWFDSFASSQDLNNQKQQLQQSQPSDEMDIEGILRFCDNASLDASGVRPRCLTVSPQTLPSTTIVNSPSSSRSHIISRLSRWVYSLALNGSTECNSSTSTPLKSLRANCPPSNASLQTLSNARSSTRLWRLILRDTTQYRHVDEFLAYLDDEAADDVKVINKDQWMSFYDFCSSVRADLSNYDESSAWPVILDEYVEWVREQ